ncbi:MAG TPA: hypothetical protein VF669_20805 [Tepidisphaeraceae bacterium]|jgi:hypothetical protein
MEIGFYRDPDSGLAHCYARHGVHERDAIQVLRRATRRFRNEDGALVAEGQTEAGRYLRVIYREYRDHAFVFVITAYELSEKAKRAFRRRRKSK